MNLRSRIFFITILLLLGSSLNAYANPQGESVVSGSATFDRSTPNTLTVNTASKNTIINYNSFSIATNETTRINQPSATSAVLNRVVGVSPSQIYGTLSSNGKLFLVNPNGILFGPGSQVNAPAILASTLDITNDDFLNGNYNFFKNGGNSYIINQGRLAALPGGYIALLSQAVNNQGVIIADLGSVALATGEKMTLALDSQSQISVVIDNAVQSEVLGPDGQQIKSAIPNSGTIQANGGKVLLTAQVLNDVFDYAINNSGVIQATALQNNNGIVELVASGAPVINTGTINATQVNLESQNSIYSTGSLITPSTLTLISAGDIYSLGVLESSSLIERGNTFQIGGIFEPGYADIKNADNALTYSSNTNVSGTISDPGNIKIQPGVDLFETAPTSFQAGGAFTMDTGATIAAGFFDLSISAKNASTLDIINNANLLTLSLGSGSHVTFTANDNITAAGLRIGANTTLSAGAHTITLSGASGAFTNNGTFSAGTSTVIFNGNGTQTLNSGNSSFYNITHSGLGTLQLITNPLTVTHNFTNSAGIFDLNGKNWTMSGATFSNNNGILQARGAETATGLVMDTTHGSVNYDGTSTYTGLKFGNVYNNLNFNGSGGTWKPIGAVTINGTLTVSKGTYNANGKTTTVTGLTSVSGGTYRASTATQTFNGGLTINGGTFIGSTGNVITTNMTLSSGTLTAPSGTFDVSGNWSQTGGTFTPGSNTVTFNGFGAQSIGGSASPTFNNLIISGSGTKTLGSDATVLGNLTIGSLVIFNPKEHTVTIDGSLSNNGTLAFGVNGITASNKTYDGTNTATLNTASAALVGGVVVNGNAVTLNKAGATGTFNSKDVGTNTVIVSGLILGGPAIGSYTLTLPTIFANINPAPLTVTANDQSKTYGTALSLGTSAFTTSGLLNSDTVTGVTLTSSGAAATANVAGSPYSITPSAAVGSGLSNYTITYHNGTLTVNPAALSITANDQSKTYGTALSLGTSAFTTSGLLNSDTVTGVTLTSSGAAATANVAGSPYSIIPSAAVGSGLSNYTITYHNGTLTVNPAALSITANDQSKTFGTPLSLGTSAFTTSGLLNSDTVTGVTLTSSGAAATATVAGSPYSIIPSAAVGSGLSNYIITYHNGALTVTSNTNLINPQLANGIIPLPTGNFVNQFFNTHNPPAPGIFFYHPLADIDSSSFDSSFLDLSDETFEFIDGRLNIVGR